MKQCQQSQHAQQADHTAQKLIERAQDSDRLRHGLFLDQMEAVLFGYILEIGQVDFHQFAVEQAVDMVTDGHRVLLGDPGQDRSQKGQRGHHGSADHEPQRDASDMRIAHDLGGQRQQAVGLAWQRLACRARSIHGSFQRIEADQRKQRLQRHQQRLNQRQAR